MAVGVSTGCGIGVSLVGEVSVSAAKPGVPAAAVVFVASGEAVAVLAAVALGDASLVSFSFKGDGWLRACRSSMGRSIEMGSMLSLDRIRPWGEKSADWAGCGLLQSFFLLLFTVVLGYGVLGKAREPRGPILVADGGEK